MPNSLPALNGGIPDWIFPVLLHALDPAFALQGAP
jgi:hypothetical protein